MPAATAWRRWAYSSAVICGIDVPSRPPRQRGGVFLVRGKLAYRLGDFFRARHEEFLLRAVEGHGGDIRRRDAHDRTIEAGEGVLGDGRGDLRAEAARQVVPGPG